MYSETDLYNLAYNYYQNSYNGGRVSRFVSVQTREWRLVLEFARQVLQVLENEGFTSEEVEEVREQVKDEYNRTLTHRTSYISVEYLHQLCGNILYVAELRDEVEKPKDVEKSPGDPLLYTSDDEVSDVTLDEEESGD